MAARQPLDRGSRQYRSAPKKGYDPYDSGQARPKTAAAAAQKKTCGA